VNRLEAQRYYYTSILVKRTNIMNPCTTNTIILVYW